MTVITTGVNLIPEIDLSTIVGLTRTRPPAAVAETIEVCRALFSGRPVTREPDPDPVRAVLEGVR